MKSIERRFNKMQAKNPDWSSYTCFAMAIAHQKLSERSIAHWLNQLVDKSDYCPKDKKELLGYLLELTNMPEEGKKQGQVASN